MSHPEIKNFEIRLNLRQLEIKKRLNKLWLEVVDSEARAFPDVAEETLPVDIRQDHLALLNRIEGIVIDMVRSQDYLPDEEKVLSGIRERTIKLLQKIDELKKLKKAS